jgi:hypothetical protein
MDKYWDSYQQGKGGNLESGLKGVDKDINNAISLSKGP